MLKKLNSSCIYQRRFLNSLTILHYKNFYIEPELAQKERSPLGKYNESTTNVLSAKANKMKRMLDIPDELWTQLDQYLKDHPEQNPSSVVQEALAEKLRLKNGSRLLSLAGIVENAPKNASVNEDYLIQG
ncbi:hypothetical protein LC593_07410 [Nostoc sp. CHAB 5844]|nr:hypothetical protein [Nostoc sp. CHAB 5844]